MANWRYLLWQRWITNILERPEARRLCGRSARRRSSGRCRSLALERLEERLVPAMVSISSVAESALELEPPVADDDFALIAVNAPAAIDVLANDFDPDGTLDLTTLTVSSGPAHGTATVQQTELGPVIVYTPNDRTQV